MLQEINTTSQVDWTNIITGIFGLIGTVFGAVTILLGSQPFLSFLKGRKDLQDLETRRTGTNQTKEISEIYLKADRLLKRNIIHRFTMWEAITSKDNNESYTILNPFYSDVTDGEKFTGIYSSREDFKMLPADSQFIEILERSKKEVSFIETSRLENGFLAQWNIADGIQFMVFGYIDEIEIDDKNTRIRFITASLLGDKNFSNIQKTKIINFFNGARILLKK